VTRPTADTGIDGTGAAGGAGARRLPAVRRRSTLAARISLLSVGIAVLTAIIAGILATSLIRNAGADSAQRTLASLADVSQAVADGVPVSPSGNGGRQQPGLQARKRLNIALESLQIRSGLVDRDGSVQTGAALVRTALQPDGITRLLSGQDVSTRYSVNGTEVLVEGRPISTGGIVLVQRHVDAVAQSQRAIRELLLALGVAGLAAAAIGLFVASRLARPLRRTAAAAHSVAAGNRDVTLPAVGPAEVVEVSDAVNHIAGALRYSEGRQREFLLSVSHDLRTPLTAITGYAESLADGVIPPEDAARVGGVLLGESKRLERLVGDLLDLARLGAQDFRVELATVDVSAVVRDAATVWSTRCAAAGLAFHLDAPPVPLLARTDAARLRQALDGLFDNALRVTPAAAPIVLAAYGEPGAVVVEVRDGGPGLSEADLDVAFAQGALQQRYRGIRRVGTGLGLAIVHGLVTRLGGQVRAGHAPEGGAQFTIRLPAAD